jgi:hypothetical protein
MVLPLGQVQVLFEQLDPPRHALPHAPQLALLVVKSTQSPAHSSLPAGHRQLPATHVALGTQACPQAPQLPPSDASSTHARLHSVSPASHMPLHLEAEQTCEPAQALLQAPQLSGSLASVAQSPSQST